MARENWTLSNAAERMRMKPGDKVVCIDDKDFSIPDRKYPRMHPNKGKTYTIRECATIGGCHAVSLMEFDERNFYLQSRFILAKRKGEMAIAE